MQPIFSNNFILRDDPCKYKHLGPLILPSVYETFSVLVSFTSPASTWSQFIYFNTSKLFAG